MVYYFTFRVVLFFIWFLLILIFMFSSEEKKNIFAIVTYSLTIIDSSVILFSFIIGIVAIYRNKRLQELLYE